MSTTALAIDKKIWSRDKLLCLYGIDLAAAASSSVLVSPFIAVVDRAIIENANGKRPLNHGLIQGFRRVFTRPLEFAGTPQFRLIFGLYFSTYITANIMDTTSEHLGVSAGTASWYKFVTTTVVNMGVCIYKDAAFTRMFGVTAVRSLPKLSYILFAARDSLTIAASFTAPSYIAGWLENNHAIEPNKANVSAQLASPALVQFVSTPFHLLGLDLYNRPTVTAADRMGFLRAEYLKSSVARVGKIGPAFGIGGVGNTYFRSFRKTVVDRY
ncbi:hypothetical protein BX666DRAFT_1928082 [Dichotomocladium elegans]|nr:hypothetical protein BX666DRAFT_1928082 [Dichotomocladium elegans]